MRVSATAKYLRGSTRKARLVTEAIKGKPVEEASAILRFMPQAAARDVARVLKSATANAENNMNRSADELYIADAIANDLARLIPGVETMGLAVSAALYDQAQILRPGWPIHAELARMHQQAQRGGWMPAVTSFGASAGRMAAPVLEPDWGVVDERCDPDPR